MGVSLCMFEWRCPSDSRAGHQNTTTGVTGNCEQPDLGTGNRILRKQFVFWPRNSLSSPVFAFLIAQSTLVEKKIHQTDNWLSENGKWSLFLIFMHYDGVSVRLQNLLLNRNFVRQGTENYRWLKHSTLWTKNK